MINRFLENCRNNSEKTAFISGRRRVSFGELKTDVFAMAALLKSKGIPEGEKMLLLVMPSYEFYVLMFACIYCGINVVVPDSYGSTERVRALMKENGVKYVLCTAKTALLKAVYGFDARLINVSGYSRYRNETPIPNEDKKRTVLTTFTSGTTGKAKPIERSIEALERQIETISKNFDIGDGETVYAGLPIYTLFLVYSGKTCVISGAITPKRFSKLCVTAVMVPIAKALKIKNSLPSVEKVYLGGAMLYSREAERLKVLFPKAVINYVYGASECVLMARSDLKYYTEHSFAMRDMIEGVRLTLVDKDSNGVGKIRAEGSVVLTEDGSFVGNDLGYIDEDGLHIVGRSRYSAEGFYNYIIDEELLRDNPKVKKGFSFVHGDRKYFCYEGKLTSRKTGIEYVRFKKLPTDPKHKTKLDYNRVIKLLQNKK